uniref:Major facilitator superfamily (MFS) profile domain-containing protein n=1 Tax=Wuchereria bancrofti TaxID=6293 RepID=A0A1I8EN34_WUCBA
MGVGFGLMYYPAIVIVTMIFEKENLSMATGIAVCDAGVGTVVFAEALIKIFRRTVFAVYAVIVLMCSLCGAIFRPLTFVAVEDETRRKYSKMKRMDSLKWCISTSFSSYFLFYRS